VNSSRKLCGEEKMAQEKMIAFCGISCSDCPAYRATMANDDELRREVAEQWGSDAFPLSAEDVHCMGCNVMDGEVMEFVKKCKVRLCASSRGVENCAHCEEYACDLLKKVWSYVGDEKARENLERILKDL
jgi:hypothetical protein